MVARARPQLLAVKRLRYAFVATDGVAHFVPNQSINVRGSPAIMVGNVNRALDGFVVRVHKVSPDPIAVSMWTSAHHNRAWAVQRVSMASAVTRAFVQKVDEVRDARYVSVHTIYYTISDHCREQ